MRVVVTAHYCAVAYLVAGTESALLSNSIYGRLPFCTSRLNFFRTVGLQFMTSIQPVSDYKNKFCSLDPVLIGKRLPVGTETALI